MLGQQTFLLTFLLLEAIHDGVEHLFNHLIVISLLMVSLYCSLLLDPFSVQNGHVGARKAD